MTLSPEQKAEKAKRILDDEVFQEAVEQARSKTKEQWTTATTPNQREALWHQYQALDEVVVRLRAMYQDGYMEQHRREKRESTS